VRLVFIHHSTGEAWLGDNYGGLGIALRNNHYYVSDTNYGWGPSGIGSSTDIGNWYDWFRGPNSATYLSALYSTSTQTPDVYSRSATPPAGSNQVIMFKSCFPNSALQGDPNAPVPSINLNPLRGQGSGSEYHTVANAKGIYIDLLNYFTTRQDKLFIIATAPPLIDGTYSSNARAFNQWLTNDYLKNYPYKNVFVFDYYNVLTTNGGDSNTNDLNLATGAHHRLWNGAIQHTVVAGQNVAAYPSGDDHPSAAGDLKATGEFVPLLNIAYNQWKASAKTPTTVTITTSTPTPTTNVPFTLSGTLKSGTTTLTNQPVHLERRTGTTGAWANVAGTFKYTDAFGKVAISQTVSTAGTYQYRWHYNGTTTYLQAYSAAVTETVKKPATLTIATSTATPTTNVPFTLSGTLKSGTTPLTNQPVHLERRTGTTGAWADVAGTFKYTDAFGKVVVSQKMATAGTYQYRWHYNGTTTYLQAYSTAVTETVKKPTTFAIGTSPTAPKLNVAFTVSGTLKSSTAGLNGLSVHLERKIGTGAWADVAGTSKNTGTGGVVSVSQKVSSHSTYSFRWHFTGTVTYQSSYSPVKTFSV